jgi:hypothetical protein
MSNSTNSPSVEHAADGKVPEIGGWTTGPIITPDGGGIKSEPFETPTAPTGPITVPGTGGSTSGADGFTTGPVEPTHTDDGSVAPTPPSNPYADAIIVNDQKKS